MADVERCEWCGGYASVTINTGTGPPLAFCPDHATEGLAMAARLHASARGAPSEVIAYVGDWAAEALREFHRQMDER